MASVTYRLAGIGESQVADLLGEPLLRATNPIVATYARAEAVDVRISAIGTDEATADGARRSRRPPSFATAWGRYIWATGDTTWAGAIGDRLAALGWTLAVVEIGTGGQVGTLLGDVAMDPRLDDPSAGDDADARRRRRLIPRARRARDEAGAEVGLAVARRPRHRRHRPCRSPS